MDDQTTVRALLDAAGFDPPPADRDAIEASFPMVRQMIASLYGVPDARYEVPALVFDPDPDFLDWW